MTRLIQLIGGALPWLVIGGLLWAALFVEPQPVGETVFPTAIERRDRFFGLHVEGDSRRLLAVGAGGKIVASDDNGVSWRVQETPTRVNLQALAVWDARRAAVVGNEGVVLWTEDGGERWHQGVAPLSDVVNKLVGIVPRPDGRAFAVGAMAAIYETRDFGRNWVRLNEEVDISLNGIAFVDDDRGWVVGEFGTMLRTEDGGASWTEAEPVVESSLMAVAFNPGGQGVAVGLEGLVILTDDGSEWRIVDTGFEQHLFAVAWAGDHWVAVGEDGILARSAREDAETWRAGRIAPNLRTWHTAVIPVDGRFYLAGATLSRLVGDEWVNFADSARNSE